MADVMRFCVMGAPIAHSLSPMIHAQFAAQTGRDLVYETCLLDTAYFEQQVRDFFAAGGAGLNITSPGKERAFVMADVKTARCAVARAANTLWMDSAGKLCADNTDGVGLVRDLHHHGMKLGGARILVLGAGGAARGILPALLDENPCEVVVANRTALRAKALVQALGSTKLSFMLLDAVTGSYDLIINATTSTDFSWLDRLGRPFCYDLNYDASGMTPFVAWAKNEGFQAVDGLGMLVEQAAEAFFVWHGIRPDRLKIAQEKFDVL
ncbi:MAG: shikimate dehydrogenase [Legionella sp.]|jgi:shikimate dehydrogenase|nr:shikimate dehydrogenase [Legionella sp.]